MSVIFYHVDGLLIDSGPGNAQKSFVRLTHDLTISQAALTHYHEDHSGNAAYLASNRQIPVYGHIETAAIMRKGFAILPYEHLIWGRSTALDMDILPDVLETDKYTFSIYHTPGHSRDHVVFLEENEGWLFSGDMFIAPKLKFFRREECMASLISSLKLITSLEFDKLFCGHNPQMQGAKEIFRLKLNNLLAFQGQVRELLEKGLSSNEIVRHFAHTESWVMRLFTMGDMSRRNMVLAAIKSITSQK